MLGGESCEEILRQAEPMPGRFVKDRMENEGVAEKLTNDFGGKDFA